MGKFNLLCKLSNLVVFFLVSTLYAQQAESIHKLHQELYGKDIPEITRLQKAEDIIPLNKSVNTDLSAAVFGYLPDWEYANGNYQYLRYDLLTHIACFDFEVDRNGNVSNPANWPWTDLINEAHENGVKIILCAVKFGGGSDDDADMHHLLTDSSAIENFYTQIVNKMKTYNMDGVNVDFETYAAADEGAVTTNFMRGLAERVRAEIPGAEISFASPIINWGDDYELFEMASFLDYMFIMGYAFYGSWSDNTGPGSPLTGGSRNLTTSLNDDYASVVSVMPEKLILGIPYYGLEWVTETSSAGSITKSFKSSPRFSAAEPLGQLYGINWHSSSQTPWFAWNNGDWNQIWYDNSHSLDLKYDLAVSKGLMGVGMWALGYDGERQELWNLIDTKFGSGELPPPIVPTGFNVTGADVTSLNLNCELPDNAEGFELLISSDGSNFDSYGIQFSNYMTATELSADAVSYFKINAFNSTGASNNTEVLAGVPGAESSKVLVVNGFDRTSGTNNTMDYITKYADPLLLNEYIFSSASNEAVYKDLVSLTDYEMVIWMLGDESTSDETFNVFEQERIEAFLENGGSLFVTGAEIGWDLSAKGGSTDQAFYSDYLKAVYIDDAPNGNSGTYYTAEGLEGTIFDGLSSFSFDDGSHGTFDIDWPDAIRATEGGVNILKFGNVSTSSGYAGFSYEGTFGEGMLPGRLVHLSIPFETIYPEEVRTDILGRVLEFFSTNVSVEDEKNNLPEDFELSGNYPNPFNPSTTIVFRAASQADYTLNVYNTLGQIVSSLSGTANIGTNNIEWKAEDNSGRMLASGTYIYRIIFGELNKALTGKMMLVR